METRDSETYAIIGAAVEVHRMLGNGFLEAVYQDALAIEFSERQIPFCMEQPLTIEYKGRQLSSTYRADFVCFDDMIVAVKGPCEPDG